MSQSQDQMFKEGEVASLEAKGSVKITVTDSATGEVIEVKNTVLDGGREALLRQLMNSYTGAYFSHMVLGDGGATLSGGTYIAENVLRTRTSLFGSEVDRVPCVGSLGLTSAGVPFLTVSSVIGADSPANGSWIHEVGLMLQSGVIYAMTTWPGVYKTNTVSLNLAWTVYFT